MNGVFKMESESPSEVIPQQRKLAKPLHIQQIENALDMRPFMRYARDILSRPLSESDENEVVEDESALGDPEEDRISDRSKKTMAINSVHHPQGSSKCRKTRKKSPEIKLGTKEGNL